MEGERRRMEGERVRRKEEGGRMTFGGSVAIREYGFLQYEYESFIFFRGDYFEFSELICVGSRIVIFIKWINLNASYK
jgi:hypothetical protein